jgi:hypothetical protein
LALRARESRQAGRQSVRKAKQVTHSGRAVRKA